MAYFALNARCCAIRLRRPFWLGLETNVRTFCDRNRVFIRDRTPPIVRHRSNGLHAGNKRQGAPRKSVEVTASKHNIEAGLNPQFRVSRKAIYARTYTSQARVDARCATVMIWWALVFRERLGLPVQRISLSGGKLAPSGGPPWNVSPGARRATPPKLVWSAPSGSSCHSEAQR